MESNDKAGSDKYAHSLTTIERKISRASHSKILEMKASECQVLSTTAFT